MIPPTRAEFLVGYPEFASAPEALVERKLADADARTGDSFGAAARSVRVQLLAARLLALSPFGRDMRMVDDGVTVYDDDLRIMNVSAAVGVDRVC